MYFARERIGEIIRQLEPYCYPENVVITNWQGKQEHFPVTDIVKPNTEEWEIIKPGILGEKKCAYFGLAADICIPETMDGMPVELLISTGHEGEWDATNPQIAAYVNGKLTQGLDVNHRNLRISTYAKAGEVYSVFMSVYTGERGSISQWNSILRAVDESVYTFYYDLLIPWQCLELMEEDSREYAQLLDILNETVNLLDFREKSRLTGSIPAASAYLQQETARLPVSEYERPLSYRRCLAQETRPLQRNTDDTVIFRVEDIPAKGWKTYRFSEEELQGVIDRPFFCTEEETETPFYHLRWNDKGQITSWYDKTAERELLKEGTCANVLMTYEDKPHIYDNWNIFDYYREKQWEVEELLSRKVIEKGPVRCVLELKWKYLSSEIREVVYFYPDSPRIDIHADIDWREDQILLKALFPLEMNAREATYEIQYGNVKRSTTRNHSWEQARFEVCFQKWMDLAEYDYGVSFITDCKYGVSVYDSQVELTLLKCGRYPNPEADRGHHEFVYSVFPHKGNWQQAGTVREAYEVNNPVVIRQKTGETGEAISRKLPFQYGAVHIDAENVVAEVLKCSEDGRAEIVRLYECWNRRTTVEITFAEKYKKISLCNMLEEEEKILAEYTNRVTLNMKPYEIVTLALCSYYA